MPILTGLLLIAAAVAPQAGCRLTITDVSNCDEHGVPCSPRLGDKVYGIRVTWSVTGQANRQYDVDFRIADHRFLWKNVNAVNAGQGYWGYADFHMPLAGPIPYSITLDRSGVSGDPDPGHRSVHGNFIPTPPTQTIDYFAPHRLRASQSMTVNVPQNSRIDRIDFMFGVPQSQGFQTVTHDPGTFGMDRLASEPFRQALYRETVNEPPARTYEFNHAFSIEASNVRADLKENMSRWSAYSGLPNGVKAYLAPESTIESDSEEVKSFVSEALGSSYRAKLTPYQAAKKLFLAVAHRLSYTTPASPDVLKGLASCKGDCGTFSSTYIAALRSIGIPARMVWGWRMGKDQWHTWSEMYVPGAGWMPQDATDCNSIQKANGGLSDFAYCFAVVPDLNQRVAVCRGSTFTTDKGTWRTMQPGQWGVWGPNPIFPTWSSSCELAEDR